MADSGSTPSEGDTSRSRHQGGQLCKNDLVHDLIYTFGTSDRSSYPVPLFSRSNSSSLFGSSDAGSSRTFSSDSPDSTRKSSVECCVHIFGTSGHMSPISSAVIPEEHRLSCLRQRSSWNPSSSDHDMDEASEFARQCQQNYQAGRGKHRGSSSRNRSFNSSCKLTEQRRITGPAFFSGRSTRERTIQVFC